MVLFDTAEKLQSNWPKDSVTYLAHGVNSKLQRVQNSVARLIVKGSKHDHITPIQKHLHWLPVDQRIVFKILLFTYGALHNIASVNTQDLLFIYTPLVR